MTASLFDTHTHLLDRSFDADREAVLERAGASGVGRVVEVAESPAGWSSAVALARARPCVRASLGLHPYHVGEFTAGTLSSSSGSSACPRW